MSDNKITEIGIKKITGGIKINVILQNFSISHNVVLDSGAAAISECLKVNSTLCKLNLFSNKITDKGIIKIADSLQANTTLQRLNISGNKITDVGAKRLTEAIQINRTLQKLNISKSQISKEGVMRIVEACTINRTLHKLVCTHNNLSKSGLAVINEYISKKNAVQIFKASWNSISCKNGELAIKTTFQVLDVRQKLQSDFEEELCFLDEITDPEHRREILYCCFEEHLNARSVNLSIMGISNYEIFIISDCLMLNNILNKLDLSNNNLKKKDSKHLQKLSK